MLTEVGRARADLKQRLQQSGVAQLQRQRNDTLGRVSAALDDAAVISDAAVEEQERRRASSSLRSAAPLGGAHSMSRSNFRFVAVLAVFCCGTGRKRSPHQLW